MTVTARVSGKAMAKQTRATVVSTSMVRAVLLEMV